ncbi:hypothetical protein [Ilumatobacter nonamiensis]|uniref:hypothetical protein n=1 Tax=Ilumatobacter nonamiensis TaxID=467093 RepID=UPI00034661DF|nr:hypothetical protein [Ilumatobacter nonamiensis]
MTTVAIVFGVLAATAAIGWFFANRQHPETTSQHEEHVTDTRSERFYDGADRPAGPDATTMDPDALGGDHRPPER